MKQTFIHAFLVVVLSLHFGACQSQHSNSKQANFTSKAVTMVSYNVENLFDTINDPTINDEDFTPEGDLKWTSKRYGKKLNDLAKVLAATDKQNLPAIITLVEVENQAVLIDLVNTEPLKQGNYKIVHYDSPDARGIDVALLYRSDFIQVLESNKIGIKYPFENDKETRDILHVKTLWEGTDTLHFFVNHWNSRREGNEITEPRRVFAAGVLRSKVDSLQKSNNQCKIIITGDFNDTPTDKSLDQILLAKENTSSNNAELHNTLYKKALNREGSYNYKNDWTMLDNIIVSQALINTQKGWSAEAHSGQIFSDDWIMYENPKAGTKVPNKTYGGKSYFGGYSDHLPVFLVLNKK